MLSNLEIAYAEKCRRNFYSFFQEFWSTIEAVELKLNWHLKLLCDELQQVYLTWERKERQPDVLINCPFGVSKSTILQLFEAWVTLRHPSVKILGTSYAAKISTKNAGKARMCLKSLKFQTWYPNKVVADREKDGKTEFANLAKGIYYTASTGGAATGQHADFIFNDDPLSAKDAHSNPKREQANEFLGDTLASRKTDKDRTVTVTVMQRLAPVDPSGYLLNQDLPLNHICLPAEVTPVTRELVKPQSALLQYEAHDNLLDPVRLSRTMLDGFRKKLGPYAYAAQVQQNPMDSDSGIFKSDWFDVISWSAFQEIANGRLLTWLFDADTALTKDNQNDPTAVLASCYLDDTLYIRNAHEERLEWNALLVFMRKFLRDNGYDHAVSQLFIEPKANGLSVFQALGYEGQVNVAKAVSPKTGKIERAHAVVPFCASKRVVLIDGSYINRMKAQLFTFPNAPHDDLVDTLTQAIQRIVTAELKKHKKAKNIYA